MATAITTDRENRLREALELREGFYFYGPKHGHAAYVSVAHLIGKGIYGSEQEWLAAREIALGALDFLKVQAEKG